MADELEEALRKLQQRGPDLYKGGWTDMNVRPSILLLTEAVLRLDKTSTRLARVNIALTIALAVIGILQIYLMARGH